MRPTTDDAANVRRRRRPQLPDEVSSYIRDLIMAGQVRAGEYLRLERIATELDVSVTPVREALLALRGEGFVQLEARRGFVVAPLTRTDVEDLFRVQAHIAGELTARAARRIDAATVDRLAALQDRLEDAASRSLSDEVEELNHAFHRTINRSAESAKLAWMLGTVVRYAPRRFYASISGWQKASVGEHRTIIAALRGGAADTARDTMYHHITHAGELLVDHLAARGLWDATREVRQ